MLPCLTVSSAGPPNQPSWYQKCQESFKQQSGGLPGLGVLLLIFNMSDQIGGFYLCQQGTPSKQDRQSGWTVSMKGSGEV